MDKNSYETYEYMTVNNRDADTDQFLVVQEDGTFLLNRQIQYVAQVQSVKEVLEDVQPCAVYGVSQQFYVDVDNSAELISVSDHFMLPDEDNGLYTNNYLLQPSTSSTAEPLEEAVMVDQYKQGNSQDVNDTDIDMVTYNSKQGNNFTEITLSDDQYQTLEQKGWILLETNEKIYVLNTLGLHDITTNDKLIQKLRNDLQNDASDEIDNGAVKQPIDSEDYTNITPALMDQMNQPEAGELVIQDCTDNNNMTNLQFPVADTRDSPSPSTIKPEEPIKDEQLDLPDSNTATKVDNLTQNALKGTSTIRIKTKCNFKDIPDKIFLGKTASGKRLVAKVIKPQNSNKVNLSQKPPHESNKGSTEQFKTGTGINDSEFIALIQESMRSDKPMKASPQDLASADTIVTQLLKLPNLKNMLIGNNILVTKASVSNDATFKRNKVSLVTGRIIEDEINMGFEYVPHLLRQIKTLSEIQNKTANNSDILNSIKEYEEKETFNICHVHVTETKCSDNLIKVSVALNKRTLPLNLTLDLKKRCHPRLYACSACATLFKTEDALTAHQDEFQGDCLQPVESENKLTIDLEYPNENDKNENKNNKFVILKSGKEVFYACTQCNSKFTKLGNCERHIRIHEACSESKGNESSDQVVKQVRQQFKCKICPSIFFHSSTLSKHIISNHIKMKT